MKKIAFYLHAILFCSLMLIPEVGAQEKVEPAKPKKDRQEILVDRLSLTPEQSAQLAEIWASFEPQLKELKASAQEERRARRKQAAHIHQKWDEEIKSILTTEQLKAYEKLKEQGKKKRSKKRKYQTNDDDR